MTQFKRTEMLLGENSMKILKNSRVAVFGIGGVGGHVVEALVRSGVGTVDIIDNDVVHNSNLNRQVIALHSTVGMDKVDAFEQRMKDINPEVSIIKHKCFFTPENSHLFDFGAYNYVADCIDTVTGKIELVLKCQEKNTPIISSMGTGNKLNPTDLEVSDIYKKWIETDYKSFHFNLQSKNNRLKQPMKFEIKEYEAKMQKSVSVYESNLSSIRASQANAAVLSRVSFDYYGVDTPVNTMADIRVSDAKTLTITPYDAKTIKDITKAIMTSDIGITPSNDGKVIRLVFPQLTEERRKEIAKQVQKMCEDAKVNVRNIRREANDAAKKMKKDNLLTEDEEKDSEKKIQELTDKFVKMIDEIAAKKDKEILSL